MPLRRTPLATLFEDIVRGFALATFMAFAPHGLTSLGGDAGDDYKGGQMFNKIDKDTMSADMVAAAMWLKLGHDCTGKIGVTGFCYEGSIANYAGGAAES